MEIETDRLILREMNKGDLDALYAAMLADPEIMKQQPQLFKKEKVRELISHYIEGYRTFGFGLLAVCLKGTGEMIGECGLTMQLIDGSIKPEIDYHIRRDMRGKGFTNEAAEAVRDWTFCNTTFHEIYLYAKFQNAKTERIAARWGCRLASEFRDGFSDSEKVYVITKNEWEKLN